MTRGQSGLLFLHCWRLSLFTLCRSPGALASVHKDLRLCDLCKELAFGHQCVNGSSRDSYNSLEFNVLWRQFLEREHPTWLAPSVEGKELFIGAASVVQWRLAEPPAEAKTDRSVVL